MDGDVRILNWVLIVSILFNFVLCVVIAYLYLKELGVNFIFQKVLDIKNKNSLKDVNPASVFNLYKKQKNTIVMLGDSITRGVSWNEFVGEKVVGRGVAGNTTKNIINRLNQVTEIKPDQVIILAGINDFARLITEKDANNAKKRVVNNYRKILNTIRKDSPDTEIIMQSILPVNRNIKFYFYKNINNKIKETNQELENLAYEYDIKFINLFDYFYKDGDLIPEYTHDGLHLTAEGYVRWKEIVIPYMNLLDSTYPKSSVELYDKP